jgi:hypothetical protein
MAGTKAAIAAIRANSQGTARELLAGPERGWFCEGNPLTMAGYKPPYHEYEK